MTRKILFGFAVTLAIAASAQPAFARHARVRQPASPFAPLAALFHTDAPTMGGHARRHLRAEARRPEYIGDNVFAQATETPMPRERPVFKTSLASVDPGEVVAEPAPPRGAARGDLEAAIARHAAMNGVPVSLVHRVIMRESRYNAGIVSRGNYGLMQIKPATARGVGYTGSASGLLDPETNLTYAVRYLAGAYRAAGGNEARAVSYYASGYYRSKRHGM